MDGPELDNWSLDELENVTENEAFYVAYSERPETYIVPTLFVIILVISIVGNVILMTIFVRHRIMRNAIRIHILCLSVGDLLAVVVLVPFAFTMYSVDSWPWGSAMCKLFVASKEIWLGVSAFTLAVLTVERYCFLVTTNRRGPSSSTIAILIFMAWAFSILFATPTVFFTELREVPPLIRGPPIMVCGYFDVLASEYVSLSGIELCRFAVYYAIPLCIMVCFSVLMTCHLAVCTAKQQPSQTEEERELVKTVLTFVVAYVVCFTPLYVFGLWFNVYTTDLEDFDELWNVFRIIGFCLSYVHSCVKPIALYYISREFRMHTNNYLFCCRRSLWEPTSVDMAQISRPSRSQNYVTTCSSD